MSGCLGSVLAALVDGELDHAAREKAHRHLAHCALCRAEVEAQRRLKAQLHRTGPAEPSSALLARLHALPTTATAPSDFAPAGEAPVRPVVATGPSLTARSRLRPGPHRPLLPALSRAPASRAQPTRPAPGRPAARPVPARPRPAALSRGGAAALSPRGVAGSALAVLGVAAALALGAPPQRAVPPTTGSGAPVLVTEVATTRPAPATGLIGAGLTPIGGRVAAAPVVRRPEVPVRVVTSSAVSRSGR